MNFVVYVVIDKSNMITEVGLKTTESKQPERFTLPDSYIRFDIITTSDLKEAQDIFHFWISRYMKEYR